MTNWWWEISTLFCFAGAIVNPINSKYITNVVQQNFYFCILSTPRRTAYPKFPSLFITITEVINNFPPFLCFSLFEESSFIFMTFSNLTLSIPWMTPFIFLRAVSNEFYPSTILNQPAVMFKPHNSSSAKVRKTPTAFTATSLSVLKSTQTGAGFQLQILHSSSTLLR